MATSKHSPPSSASVRASSSTVVGGWLFVRSESADSSSTTSELVPAASQEGLTMRTAQIQSKRRFASSGRLQRARSVSAKAVPATAPDLPYRVGHGFDLHRLAEGYDLIIGGKKIPHTKGCEAHSDGDVLLHCVTDAILGAGSLSLCEQTQHNHLEPSGPEGTTYRLPSTPGLGAGALSMPDIGQIFPDNDPKWSGASSDIFVKEACKLMKEKGFIIGNIDCTLIAQRPKLSPHKEDIRCAHDQPRASNNSDAHSTQKPQCTVLLHSAAVLCNNRMFHYIAQDPQRTVLVWVARGFMSA